MAVNFDDLMRDTEIPETNDYRTYDGPPQFRWNNGVKSKQRGVPDVPGSFYISERYLGDFVPGEPWRKVQRYEDEIGYEAEELELIFLMRRSQPYREEENGKKKRRVWMKQWVKGVSTAVCTEVLCYAEGFGPDGVGFGLGVWSAKGMVGIRIDEILKNYRENLLASASNYLSKLKGKTTKAPRFMFALHVQPQHNGKGFVFTDTGHQSFVQLPQAVIPEVVNQEVFANMFVGTEMLAELKTVYEEHEKWQTTMRTNDGRETQQSQDTGEGYSSSSEPEYEDVDIPVEAYDDVPSGGAKAAGNEAASLRRRYDLVCSALKGEGWNNKEIKAKILETVPNLASFDEASVEDRTAIVEMLEGNLELPL